MERGRENGKTRPSDEEAPLRLPEGVVGGTVGAEASGLRGFHFACSELSDGTLSGSDVA